MPDSTGRTGGVGNSTTYHSYEAAMPNPSALQPGASRERSSSQGHTSAGGNVSGANLSARPGNPGSEGGKKPIEIATSNPSALNADGQGGDKPSAGTIPSWGSDKFLSKPSGAIRKY